MNFFPLEASQGCSEPYCKFGTRVISRKLYYS